ncbi:hypothetical protein [Winogradskyella sp. 4-2091]
MKPLQNFKKRLQKLSIGRVQNSQKVKNTKPKTLITKAFSKDEDTFMFI